MAIVFLSIPTVSGRPERLFRKTWQLNNYHARNTQLLILCWSVLPGGNNVTNKIQWSVSGEYVGG